MELLRGPEVPLEGYFYFFLSHPGASSVLANRLLETPGQRPCPVLTWSEKHQPSLLSRRFAVGS